MANQKPAETPVPVPGEDSNILHMDFSMKRKPKLKMTSVMGVDVVFIDDEGNKRLVRTTLVEQNGIVNRLVGSRQTSVKEFQYADVVVLPAAVACEMDQIIELASVGNQAAQQRALALLANVSEEGANNPPPKKSDEP